MLWKPELSAGMISHLACRLTSSLTLFCSVVTAKFPDTHRSFTGEDSTVHYLAILNPDCPDMFVLLYVDENNDSAVSIANTVNSRLADTSLSRTPVITDKIQPSPRRKL